MSRRILMYSPLNRFIFFVYKRTLKQRGKINVNRTKTHLKHNNFKHELIS